LLGVVVGFVPGFSSNNLSMLVMSYGLISYNYHLTVTIIAIEISSAFFEFLSPMIFGIGSDATVLVTDIAYTGITEESFKRGMILVISGGIIGILVAFPLIFFAEKIYPTVYSSLKPLVGWILLFLCTYMAWIERGWEKKFFAVVIFLLSGIMGLLIKNSGLISSDYLLLPVFVGLYGFSSILSGRHQKSELIQDITLIEKIRATVIAFIASMFGSMIPGMKRGQTSAIALQIGGVLKREEILFILPLVSLAFITLSIFVLGSTGRVRSNLTYDIQEVVGTPYFSETVLFAGSVAIAACIAAVILFFAAKPIGKLLSKANEKYLKVFGFIAAAILVVAFTGVYGILLAFTTTCIGLLSSKFGIRSVHLMGVLLLPSIISSVML
jgi:putative membrane protein